jgi:co-chaperonin GroES (HSP10)
MKLIPKNRTILVEAIDDTDEMLSSGIILPKFTKDEESLAKGRVVVSASDEYKDGDTIIFNKFQPDDISFNEKGVQKHYWIIRDSDVILKIE